MSESDRERLVRLTAEWAEVRRQLGASLDDDPALLAREGWLRGAIAVYELRVLLAEWDALELFDLELFDLLARVAQQQRAVAAPWN